MTAQPLEARRRNAAVTRDAILRAARSRFQRECYEQVGVRAIAADAGVDPALISRYFGSKEGLFAKVLASTSKDPMEVLGGDRATFGERVARAVLAPSQRRDACMDFLLIATRSSASPAASRLVRSHIEKQFLKPFGAWLGGQRAAEKAWLAACLLTGVAVMAAVERHASAKENGAALSELAALLQGIVDGS